MDYYNNINTVKVYQVLHYFVMGLFHYVPVFKNIGEKSEA